MSEKWNSNNFIIFQTVILQWERHVTGEQMIQWRITKLLDAWELDHHQMLVKETDHTCEKYLPTSYSDESEEQRA